MIACSTPVFLHLLYLLFSALDLHNTKFYKFARVHFSDDIFLLEALDRLKSSAQNLRKGKHLFGAKRGTLEMSDPARVADLFVWWICMPLPQESSV